LVLGYLDPDFYLGGRRRLKPDLARRALEEKVARPLGVSVEEAALRVKDAAERAVTAGIKALLDRPAAREALGATLLEGVALIAYGGGGGILLPSVARRLGIRKVFLSALSPVFSAFGVSTFDIQHRYEARTQLDGEAEMSRVLAPLVDAARRDVRGEGFDIEAAHLEVSVLGDGGEALLEDVPLLEFTGRLSAAEVPAGSSVVLSLSATCPVAKPDLPSEGRASSEDPSAAQTETREILLPEGPATVAVYARDRLRAGHVTAGPCLIESAGSTYLVPEGVTCSIDRRGTGILT
jgi:N-methylhydantoinase A/oxoprolinase/acetone carboxylase beta subunit